MVHTATSDSSPQRTDAIWTISVILLQVAAFWRVWVWYFNRVQASPEEMFGLLILVATSILLCTQPRTKLVNRFALMPIILLVGLYVISYPFVPPLLRAAIATAALGTTLYLLCFGQLPPLAVWALFFLALPVVPTMQFYLGYPARIVAATLTVPILQLGGFAVSREGTALLWNGQMLQFDAPCSGVKMLWAGLFVTLALAAYYRFGILKLTASVVIGLVAVLLGNVLRASSLFYIEAGILESPVWWHTGIGLVAFVFTAIAIAYGVHQLQAMDLKMGKEHWGVGAKGFRATRHQLPSTSHQTPVTRHQSPDTFHFSRKTGSLPVGKGGQLAFILLCMVSVFMPIVTVSKGKTHDFSKFPGWPTSFDNKPIHPLPISEREKVFGKGFPGALTRFTDGRREIVIRWVTQATRQLHPASDCFRGIGYTIKPAPMRTDSDNFSWGCFKARRADQTLRVYEQIVDADGKRWNDVSAWYWDAFLGRSTGPWWAYTIAERTE